MGAKVAVVEVDPVRALSAAMDGYRVVTADDAARISDVFDHCHRQQARLAQAAFRL